MKSVAIKQRHHHTQHLYLASPADHDTFISKVMPSLTKTTETFGFSIVDISLYYTSVQPISFAASLGENKKLEMSQLICLYNTATNVWPECEHEARHLAISDWS